MIKNKKIFVILAGVGFYLLSTGISFAVFNFLGGPSGPVTPVVSPLPEEGESKFRVDLTQPKTEACPLNGGLFTKEEAKIWAIRRPLGVMIENHEDSRPQSGLSRADVVFEAVAEGGITRFLSVFLCGASALNVQVGPVRSARTHFVDLISGFGNFPLYTHVGGANDFDGLGTTHPKLRALEQIQSYGWKLYNDLDSMSLSFPVFWRDEERLGRPVAVEHTMYASVDRLYEEAAKRGLTNVDKEDESWDKGWTPWEFKDDASQGERSDKSPQFSFWKDYSAYGVKWEYDSQNNNYKRLNGGSQMKDRNDDREIQARVVVVAFMTEKGPLDANKHLMYGTTGSGKAVVFQDGQAIDATWNKTTRTTQITFKDTRGKVIKFNRGQIWVEILPVGTDLKY